MASQVALVVKNPPANAGDLRDLGWSLDQEDPMEEAIATHSSILAWGIPWTEEPGGLWSIELQRVRHNWSYLACKIWTYVLTDLPHGSCAFLQERGANVKEKK